MKWLSAILILLGLCVSAEAEEHWLVEPDFKGKKARKDISGAACGPDRCIAVNDETHYIQEFSIEGSRLHPGERIDLLGDDREIDAEAISYSDGVFYITGSHGLSRKKARLSKPPFNVFRLKGDEIRASTRLRQAIKRTPALTVFAEQPLHKNGVNIEGLAVVDERMFFGFRGPSVAGEAFVLETTTHALFSEADPITKLHVIPLGKRIGIRDMASVSDGILLLTGPVNTLPRRYTVALWQPKNGRINTLATLRFPGSGKPETLLVLGETAQSIDVLVLHDGARNGAPRQLELKLP